MRDQIVAQLSDLAGNLEHPIQFIDFNDILVACS